MTCLKLVKDHKFSLTHNMLGRTLETRLEEHNEEHNGEAPRRTVDKSWGDHMRAKHAGIT